MKNTTKYLTEKTLGEKLRILFPKSEIIPQYPLNKRRIDYAIKLTTEEKNKMLNCLRVYGQDDLSDLPPDYSNVTDDSEKFTLLVEYDGDYHYSDNNIFFKDSKTSGLNCEWTRLDDDSHFMLRIPYFVQLDSRLCNLWFGQELDLSDGFPQGFISDKCRMPSLYTSYGERRFLGEISNLPKDIGQEIYKSLENKVLKNGVAASLSTGLLRSLFELFDSKRLSILTEMEEVTIESYKAVRFNQELYYIYNVDSLIRSVHMDHPSDNYPENLIRKNMEKYREYHSMYK